MTTRHNTTKWRRFGRARIIGVVVAIAVGITALTIIAASRSGGDTAGAGGGTPAPTVAFQRFDGSSATLADYRGRPLVVNFWASWCPSCVAEMSAAFRPAQVTLGDRVRFLGVNLQDERSRALAMVEETGVLFELAEDQRGDLYVALGGIGMPFTVFIDAAGSVIHTHNGPVTEQQLLDLVERFLFS